METLAKRYRMDDFRQLQNQFNRVFEPFFGRMGFFDEEGLASGTWVPPVDVSETSDRITIRAEVPGMRQEDIDVRYEDGVLTLKGERKFDREDSTRQYHRIERSYGNFVRSFTLPRTVDPEQITASYRDGVLEIEFPKRDDAKPKQIKVGIK